MDGLALKSNLKNQKRQGVVEVLPQSLLKPASELSPQLEAVFQSFWMLDLQVRLLSIAENPHYYWHLQDYYVAQKGLDQAGKRWAQLRISEDLCRHLFESQLGKSPSEADFTLADIRSFEVFLLEQFTRKLFQTLMPGLIKSPKNGVPFSDKEPMMHMVWALEGEAENSNLLILTAPQSCLKALKADTPPESTWTIPEENLLFARGLVRCRVGSTKAKLEDIQQLEPGDVVFLENSHAGIWFIHGAEGWFKVPVTLPPQLQLPGFKAEQGTSIMPNETPLKQTIWDNLEVEVTAAFNPIKLPLKRLKEMEKGLVIEIGDLMDSQIHLEIEGHPVAWGELLVLGDKFGVRIQGVMEPKETSENALNASGNLISPSQNAFDEPLPSAGGSNDMMDLDLDESDFENDEDWT